MSFLLSFSGKIDSLHESGFAVDTRTNQGWCVSHLLPVPVNGLIEGKLNVHRELQSRSPVAGLVYDSVFDHSGITFV